LLASVLFGALWTFVGLEVTVVLFLAGLLMATGLSWVILSRSVGVANDEPTTD
jgi:hypothetical protein